MRSQTVEWDGKALLYTETKISSTVTNRTVIPTTRQWQEFWAATERMELSKWKRLYETPHVMDGWAWHIEITHGTQKIDTLGRNAVPDGKDVTKTARQAGPNTKFNEFKSALEVLLGFKLR